MAEEEAAAAEAAAAAAASLQEQGAGLLMVLERVVQMEQSVEEALMRECQGREAGDAELRELWLAECQGQHAVVASLEKQVSGLQLQLQEILREARGGGGGEVEQLRAEVAELRQLAGGGRLEAAAVEAPPLKEAPHLELLHEKMQKLEEGFAAELQELQQRLEGGAAAEPELREVLGREEEAREAHFNSVQELLAQEVEARQAHMDAVKEHLTSERLLREGQNAILEERLGSLEGLGTASVAGSEAHLGSSVLRGGGLEERFGKMEAKLEAELKKVDEALAAERQSRERQAAALAQRMGQTEASAHEASGRHAAELRALQAELEQLGGRAAENEGSPGLQLLSDRLAALEERERAFSSGRGRLDGLQQPVLTGESTELLEHLETQKNIIEAKQRSLELCIAKEQNSREIHENVVGDQLRSEKAAREQQLQTLATLIQQEREEHARHFASVNEVLRSERAHVQGLLGAKEEELARERAARERAQQQLQEIFNSNDSKGKPMPPPSESSLDVTSRMATIERTMAVLGDCIKAEQSERSKDLSRVWATIDNSSRKVASPPVPPPRQRSASPTRTTVTVSVPSQQHGIPQQHPYGMPMPLQQYVQPPPHVAPPQVAPPQVAPPQVAPPQVAPPQVAQPQIMPPGFSPVHARAASPCVQRAASPRQAAGNPRPIAPDVMATLATRSSAEIAKATQQALLPNMHPLLASGFPGGRGGSNGQLRELHYGASGAATVATPVGRPSMSGPPAGYEADEVNL